MSQIKPFQRKKTFLPPFRNPLKPPASGPRFPRLVKVLGEEDQKKRNIGEIPNPKQPPKQPPKPPEFSDAKSEKQVSTPPSLPLTICQKERTKIVEEEEEEEREKEESRISLAQLPIANPGLSPEIWGCIRELLKQQRNFLENMVEVLSVLLLRCNALAEAQDRSAASFRQFLEQLGEQMNQLASSTHELVETTRESVREQWKNIVEETSKILQDQQQEAAKGRVLPEVAANDKIYALLERLTALVQAPRPIRKHIQWGHIQKVPISPISSPHSSPPPSPELQAKRVPEVQVLRRSRFDPPPSGSSSSPSSSPPRTSAVVSHVSVLSSSSPLSSPFQPQRAVYSQQQRDRVERAKSLASTMRLPVADLGESEMEWEKGGGEKEGHEPEAERTFPRQRSLHKQLQRRSLPPTSRETKEKGKQRKEKERGKHNKSPDPSVVKSREHEALEDILAKQKEILSNPYT